MEAAKGLPEIDGYELLSEIGRGGMGVVYLARQTALKRTVALKMVLGGSLASLDNLARFRTEAEAVARLQHPNIVQVYEVGEQAGRPFFSLEFMAGGSLDDFLDGQPQPSKLAAEMMKTLAEAVHHAHEQGVVHRDLKPANVLLAPRGPEQRPTPGAFDLDHWTLKITDFGLAKRLDDDASPTHTGDALGTPSYMAPEQAWGRKDAIGPATDVHALGAILYELLTGRPPFRGETPMDTLMQVVGQEPVPPSRLQPKVPRDLQTICLKCLRKQPRKRYRTAALLADDLRRFLNREPIHARPVGPLERAWKWARRRPAWAALIGVCVLTVVGILAGGIWHHLEIREALSRTAAAEKQAEKNADDARENANQAQINAEEVGRQRQRAEANFARARDAVDRMLTRVAEEDLADMPHMERTREALLADALAFYQDFFKEKGDDPAVRQDTARAYRRVGDLLVMLNKHDRAAEAYRQSLALQLPLATVSGAAADARNELSNVYHNFATLLVAVGDYGAAVEMFDKARELRLQLVNEAPESPAYALSLASTYNSLGSLYKETGETDKVAEAFFEAGKICARLTAKDPTQPAYRRQWAATLVNAGSAFGWIPDRSAKAQEALAKGIDLLEALHKEDPRATSYRLELARAYREAATLITRDGVGKAPSDADHAQAKRHLDQALSLARQLRDDFPDVPKYALEMAASLLVRGAMLRQDGDAAAAKKVFDEALRTTEDLASRHTDVPRYREELARNLVGVSVALLHESNPPLAEVRKHLSRGVDLWRDLKDRFPNMALYKMQLGTALTQWSGLLRKSGELAKAGDALREALDLHQEVRQAMPKNLVLSRFLRLDYLEQGDLYVAQKDHVQAAEAARKVVSFVSDRDVDGLVGPARILARCTALTTDSQQARAYADQAMVHLKEAVKRGFKDGGKMRGIARDSEVLAHRDDFRQLAQQIGVTIPTKKR
jgi:tetratricopeptide (TPR) repeat protein